MSPLLTRVIDFASQLPHYTRVWLNDEIWQQLWEEQAAQADPWAESEPVYDAHYFYLLSIQFLKRSHYQPGV